MISDSISNLSRYNIPGATVIARYLKETDLSLLTGEEIEIDGRSLFVRPSQYLTKLPAEGRFETHRIYADLQFIVLGAEIMQTACRSDLTPLTEYDAAGDYQFFSCSGQVSDLAVPKNHFAFFFPGEAHRPCCHYQNRPSQVRKLVFKIRMEKNE